MNKGKFYKIRFPIFHRVMFILCAVGPLALMLVNFGELYLQTSLQIKVENRPITQQDGLYNLRSLFSK